MEFLNRFKREKIDTTSKCTVESAEDCVHESHKNCGLDKKTCLHTKEESNKKNGIINYRLSLFILVGVIVYMATFFIPFSFPDLEIKEYIYDALRNLSLTCIGGAIISYIIDIPSKLKDYEESFINALTSNIYLRKLDNLRLLELRKKVTEYLHKRESPNIAKGLIELDQKICDLLNKPYFSRYHHSITCTDFDEFHFIKEHRINYVINNPSGQYKKEKHRIQSEYYIQRDGDSPTEDYFSDYDIKYKVDESSFIRGFEFTPTYKKTDLSEYYNTSVKLTAKDNNKGDFEIEYENKLEVTLFYKLKVPKHDVTFTKRLSIPTKNFRLQYYIENNTSIKLYGQLFGTTLKQDDIRIQHINDNYLNIETSEWLLPTNGVFVIMADGPRK